MTPLLLTQPDQTQIHTSLADLCKQKTYTILYFYPKDNTSGCTLEAQEFSNLLPEFEKLNTQVIGVSKDSHDSHCKFQTKHGLTIPLISDTDLVLVSDPRFDVRKEKSMYGRQYMGVERSTFLLDADANIIHTRRQVKASLHAEYVLEFLITLLTP